MTSDEISAGIVAAWQAMLGWELVAVILALAYVLLAMKERIECWYAALGSTSIYIFLFWDVNLLMESALQLYYLAMAVYGWWQWRNLQQQDNQAQISTWSLSRHSIVIGSVLVLACVSGYLLSENTTAAWPYIDSFTTWSAVVTTYMVARKVLENWLYWVVVNSVSIFLYLDKGLYLTAILFMLYVIIAICGFFQWLSRYRQQLERQENV